MMDFFDHDKKEMDEPTLEEFETLVDSTFQIRAEMDELERQKKLLRNELDSAQEKILTQLEAHGKSTHAGRLGTISIRMEAYPSMPKDPEKKDAFFAYLKGKGEFESMITVNAQSLRAYYKAEAAEHENDPDFKIPGLEPFEKKSITMRKKK